MWQDEDESPTSESTSDPKGEEIQKLSVIQSLPNLLATDAQSCMSRVVPKMQQALATACTEFHIAASSTFKTILEQNLVSHSIFSQTFLQTIINSLESRDPVIYHAWLETLLDVIELLPIDVIRTQILPMAVSKGQLSQPIYSRMMCSRLLGKICTRFNADMIQKEVLPTVQSLCQDVNSEVRASICLQLRFVAEGLGAESLKPALLPSLVELARDEESNVRYASVQTIVYLLPHFQEDTIKTIIDPLIKKLCENAVKSDDNVICIIAQEFGKLVLGLEKYLSPADKTWFLKYFQQLAQMGIPSVKKQTKPDLPILESNSVDYEKCLECRRCSAFNLPAMFIFISPSVEDTDSLLSTFSALTNDSYYIIRRTVASGIHEVAKILGMKNGKIKGDFIKLLKDDPEEVLQKLVPNISSTLECLVQSKTIGPDRVDSNLMEVLKALLICEAEIASTHNWRLASTMHAQLEILPKCFPSDIIYSYFVPLISFRILNARPLPVRLAAGRLLLVFLRYNNKFMQKAEFRNKIYVELASNPDCYVRMIFVRMMVEALFYIFPSAYFKEHFFTVLLNLAEDPVANIRLKVVSLLPFLKSQLVIPTDKKLLTALEATVRHLLNSEKDKDVVDMLTNVVQKLEQTEVKYERQSGISKMTKQDVEDGRKFDEEKRLLYTGTGKSPVSVGTTSKRTINPSARGRLNIEGTAKTLPQPRMKIEQSSQIKMHNVTKSPPVKHITTPRHTTEALKSSISSNNLTRDWSNKMHLIQYLERMGQSSSSINVSSLFRWPHICDLEHKEFISQYCTCYNISPQHSYPRSELKQDILKNILSADPYSQKASTNIVVGDKTPVITNFPMNYNNSCWASSSVHERPVTLSDNEFLVDAGIRIPKLSSPKNTPKCPMENLEVAITRLRRDCEQAWRSSSASYKGIESKRHSSIEYEDHTKHIANTADQLKTIRSMDYEEGLRHRNMLKENSNDQLIVNSESRTERYSVFRRNKLRFGFDANQGRSVDDKVKRNSLILDKDKTKITQPKYGIENLKRHSMNSGLKHPDYSKDSKLKFKRHSLDMTDYFGRNLRRYSTLDVNHNQGVSKIPLRDVVVSGSRTAPATRASSPVCLGSIIRFNSEEIEDVPSSTTERHLTRSLSNEQLNKIRRILVLSRNTPSNTTGSPRSRDSKLPVRLVKKKM
ncbi:PREDICTED: serine/threonine-protein phosphatase 4 regulatory subunit 4-like isoform X1 [Polistes dominula]|uniref:Serine/threonine-protein phosphatase 4 regulatory subunit 4-like isoform X1 n=1 Tax=Polistes dominula TaxID=743375 RepID=A0ABM1IZI4_POLDO|nr:PREDICTED: serine/threonine-protein phosphatase 4 regulatory subunit 4-like isoform X1 [Polistes dominula]